MAKLLYDEKTRDEYSRVLGSIPDTMTREFERRGLSPQKAAILPNVLDVVKYAVDRVFELGDPKQAVKEFKKDWPTIKSYFSRKPYGSRREKEVTGCPPDSPLATRHPGARPKPAEPSQSRLLVSRY